MAHERIDIDATLSMGQALLEALDMLAIAKGQINRLKENNIPMVDGLNYSRVSIEYGCAETDAQDLHNLIAGADAVMDEINDLYNLMTRCDQG